MNNVEEKPKGILEKLGLSGKTKKRDAPFSGRNRAQRREDERNERRSKTRGQLNEERAKLDRKKASAVALHKHLDAVRARTAKRHAELKKNKKSNI